MAHTKQIDEVMPLTIKCLRMFKYKFAVLSSAICLVGWAPAVLLYSFYCFKVPTLENWIRFGPDLFSRSFLFLQLFSSMYCYLNIAVVREPDLFILDLNFISPSTRTSIVQKSRTGDRWFVVIAILLMSSSEIMRQEMESGTSYLTVMKFIADIPSLWKAVALYQKITLNFLAFVSTVTIFYIFYLSILIEVQFLVLKDFVENPLQHNIGNSSTQNYVKCIIKRHQEIVQFYIEARKQLYVPCILTGVGILFILVFHLMTIFSDELSAGASYYSFLVTIVITAVVSHEEQLCENLSDDFSTTLYNLKWYEWDKGTLKIFHILLISASKPLNWGLTPNVHINHQYFMQVMRVIYTLGNLLKSLSY